MLICSGCGHEHPKGARFCNGCGAALAPRWSLGRALAWTGRTHECERIYDQAAEIGGGDGGVDIEVLGERIYVDCLSIRSVVKVMLGRPREGLEFAGWLPAELRRSGRQGDMSGAAADRVWACWILGDAERARRYTGEALRIGERFGTDRNVVYVLLACGIASCLGLRSAIKIANEAHDRMLKMMIEFGMTPSSRARVKIRSGFKPGEHTGSPQQPLNRFALIKGGADK